MEADIIWFYLVILNVDNTGLYDHSLHYNERERENYEKKKKNREEADSAKKTREKR